MSLLDALPRLVGEAAAIASRRNKQLNYSAKLIEQFSFAPKEFYKLVLTNVADREIPDIESQTILLHQSGIFSAKRLYLQLRRERIVFEMCGAPFGNGFFVSLRVFDRRREARWYHFLLVLALLAMLGIPLWFYLGFSQALIITTGCIALIWSIMRLALLDSMKWLQDHLPDVPVLGPIFEFLFRPETYFRQDSNTCYVQAVQNAFNQTIQEMVGKDTDLPNPLTFSPPIEEMHQP